MPLTLTGGFGGRAAGARGAITIKRAFGVGTVPFSTDCSTETFINVCAKAKGEVSRARTLQRFWISPPPLACTQCPADETAGPLPSQEALSGAAVKPWAHRQV